MASAILQSVLSFRESRISLDRFSAVGGTSLLSSTRRTLSGVGPVSYFDFCSLAEFLDALLLHEHIALIGTLRSEDQEFLGRLRATFGDTAVILIADQAAFEEVANGPNVRRELTAILEGTFGRRAPALSPTMLNQRVPPSRFSDDHKAELVRKFASFCTRSGSRGSCDYDHFADYLVAEYLRSLSCPDRKFVVNHLFRTFLNAAIAANNDGSVIAEGLRKYVLSLIQARLQRNAPTTLAKRLYDIANGAFRLAVRPVLNERTRYPFVSLGVACILADASDRGSILTATRGMRSQLQGYRENLTAIHKGIIDPGSSLSHRVKAQADLLGSGADYLRRIIEQLGLPRPGIVGLFEKLWLNSVDSLAGIPKVTVGSAVETEGEVAGSIGLSLLRGARKAWVAQKKENELRSLLSMASKVATTPGLNSHIAKLFPIDNLDEVLVAEYEESQYAV